MDLSPVLPPLTASHLSISGGRPQRLIASGGLVWVVCRAVPLLLWCVSHRFPFPIATGFFFYTLPFIPRILTPSSKTSGWTPSGCLLPSYSIALVLIGIHFYKYVKYGKIQRVETLFDSILILAVCLGDFGLIWSPWTPHAEARTPASAAKRGQMFIVEF